MYKTIKLDNTKRNRFFEKLCVKTQDEMIEFLIEELSRRKRPVNVGSGYIYSEGTLPILLVAHMDTVHKEVPREIIYENGKVHSPQGIGGDDRCGIYMILKIIRELDCHVAFFEDEECGGIGSKMFSRTETCKNLAGRINYVIELDRMNANDAVYYDCDNMNFSNFVEKEFWKYSIGSFTDICEICPVIKCAGVNLSCGYYNQHKKEEYVVLNEMETAIAEVKKLIKRTKDEDKFEYIEKKYNYYGGYGYGAYKYSWYGDNAYDSYEDFWRGKSNTNKTDECYSYEISWEEKGKEYCTEYIGCSEAEALGNFMMDYPYVSYNDVLYIMMLQ